METKPIAHILGTVLKNSYYTLILGAKSISPHYTLSPALRIKQDRKGAL